MPDAKSTVEEPVITPEMVQAGEWVMEQYRDSFADYLLVAEVYKAMAAVAPRPTPEEKR